MAPPIKYNISIDPSLIEFKAEIYYALGYMGQCYNMVLDKNFPSTFVYGGKKADMPGSFFLNMLEVGQDGLNLKSDMRNKLFELWPEHFDTNTALINYDIIGLIFFMLSRIEERDLSDLDQHQRFQSKNSIAFQKGWLRRAVVDEVASLLAQKIVGKPLQPITKFEIVPTHDVDRLRSYHRLHEPIRYSIGDLIKRKDIVSAFKRLGAYFTREPKSSFEKIMRLSEAYGLKSKFFFMSASNEKMDSTYAINMSGLLIKIITEVKHRGHGVGFHPGYNTYANSTEFNKQKCFLESLVGINIFEGRQHVIRYDAAITPQIWNCAGMEDDYSLFYPDKVGFRNGACHRYTAFDLINRKELRLQQTATSIAEFSLLDRRYSELSYAESLEQSMEIVAEVKKYKGRLVILFHTGHTDGLIWKFYKNLIRMSA